MAKTLGIAFGGSGAQGIANIAYIKALEASGIKPSIVSGTGIGAVVAAMYSAGMTAQNMIDFMQEVDFPGSKRPININKIKDAKYGILDSLGLEEYYKMIVPIKVFDRLYFPLKIVAANCVTGEEVVFAEGDVGPAVRSAAAVPGVFMPHEANGAFLMDGSCVNPVPFDVIRDDCDVLAAIDPQVNEEEAVPLVYSVLSAAFNATKKALSLEKQKTHKVDVFESFVVEEISMYDFALYNDIIDSLEERAGLFALKVQDMLK